MLERERYACAQLALVVRLRDPDARPEPGRLDEDRKSKGIARFVAESKGDVFRDRNPVVSQHRLEDVLVHAERRGEHARADVGDTGELEQALHGAVLAERAVQHREDDIDVRERRRDVLAGQSIHARTWFGRTWFGF